MLGLESVRNRRGGCGGLDARLKANQTDSHDGSTTQTMQTSDQRGSSPSRNCATDVA